MNTSPITSDSLRKSVVAVPPLARDAGLQLNRDENMKIVRHLETGGVRILLYGGNANLYHVQPSEYPRLLEMLAEIAGDETQIIPSVGPAFGTTMDQAAVLRDFPFPTAMILPQRDMTTSSGVATGVRKFAEKLGRPVVLYIKHEGFIDVTDVERLVNDRLVSVIKYAIVRDDAAQDRYLRELTGRVDPQMILSGMGEQPAIVHMRDFRLVGFTSGVVCVAPKLSQQMLDACVGGDFKRADDLRWVMRPLEDLRNEIHPVRVLHAAVKLAGIAETGPALPLLSDLEEEHHAAVEKAAKELLARN